MLVNEFDFDLPQALIAQTPLANRSDSRLMVLRKDLEMVIDDKFSSIQKYLKAGDVLVLNDSKVIPARLIGVKEGTLAKVEVLLLSQSGDTWETLVGNARVVKQGTIISFGEGKLKAKCLKVLPEGLRVMQFMYQGLFFEVLDQLGQIPLPPYIHQTLSDKERYQTVYAQQPGSVAAPTAGLHFTKTLIADIEKMGVTVVYLTLHIGLGTFRPVKVDKIIDHHMHREYYQIDQNTADILNKAKQKKQRIVAVGTTCCRTLEANFSKYQHFEATSESTDIFIYPGYQFKAINTLITNFHLPKSTLVMLVSAFAGKEFLLNSYQKAIELEYRFFSFGDSMMICNE